MYQILYFTMKKILYINPDRICDVINKTLETYRARLIGCFFYDLLNADANRDMYAI